MKHPRIGLLARADNGGIAAQSQEFAKALPVEATLVVDLGDKGRGPTYSYPWPVPHYVTGPDIDDEDTVEQFLDRVDVVISIETFYGLMVIDLCKRRGIPTVRYANPELYKNEEESHVVLPTEWEKHRIPQAAIIPQGVSVPTNIREFVRDRPVRNILHMGAPAMLDRNGTGDFYAALMHTRKDFNVTVVGPQTGYQRNARHSYLEFTDFVENRLDWYTEEIDLMVLPRKYGGLCLPMLEAAAAGIPTLTTDLSPQNMWFTHDALLPTTTVNQVKMVGGLFKVYDSDVRALSYRLDRYYDESIRLLSRQAIAYAEFNSWDRIAPMWMSYLNDICS